MYQWLKTGVRDWMNWFIYSLYTPPVFTRNYSAIVISTIIKCYTHTLVLSW
jgi:hypothetical protein